MPIVNTIKKAASTIKGGRIPYNYVVGAKDSSSPIPFDVKISFDPEAKKTILKAVGITALGLTLLGAGIAYSNRRKKNNG